VSFRVFATGSCIAQVAKDFLLSEGCVLEQGEPSDAAEDIAEKVAALAADALIVRQGQINDAVIAASENLKVICKHGIGTDNIDIDAASRRGIRVVYTPNANYECVAEHALGLMLSLSRKIPSQDRQTRRGEFSKKGFDGQELQGKTVGLVGFGRIARRLCELLAPFKVSVVTYHPSNTRETLAPYIRKVNSVEEVLRFSDIVSLHLPLDGETRQLIDRDRLEEMKSSAYLINTARGGLVNEAHLIAALKKGQIRGAALDTFEVEPVPPDSPLYDLDNVVLTMHTAGNSDASLARMAMDSATNVLAVLRGDSLDPRIALNGEP
jgi:D-3-phosphoglycerate dehydrogenase